MKLLAFDTSTERMSAAVGRLDDGRWQRWERSMAGGAAASHTLLPTIHALLDESGMALAQIDAIAFGCGPGAFTGLRTACAVAQGLAFGALGGPRRAEIPLLPVDTLMTVAEQARLALDLAEGARVLALLDARMDEIYSAPYQYLHGRWHRRAAHALGGPHTLALPSDWAAAGTVLAGNVFDGFDTRLPWPPGALARAPVVPDASALLRLAPGLLADGLAVDAARALPLYIRDKVAQTEAERAARRDTPSPSA